MSSLYDALMRRDFAALAALGCTVSGEGVETSPQAPTKPTRGRGVRREPGVMNKMEAAYAQVLEARKLAGEIAEWHFDCIKLRLAAKCFYTPDFMVMMPDGEIVFFEVKGHWEDDARVKIKMAAENFPFMFIAVRRVKGVWEYETV